jgi:hypothetical protein
MSKRWNDQEDELLRKVYVDMPKREIIKVINRDWESIKRRARALKIKRNPDLINAEKLIRATRKDAWTEEQDDFLRSIYENSTKEQILSQINRPWKGIFSRAKKLGLVRNKEIVKKEMIEGGKKSIEYLENTWSPEEDNLVKELYPKTPREKITGALVGRTWIAIKSRAFLLGVHRDEEIVRQENAYYSSKAVKEKYGTSTYFKTDDFKEKARNTNLEKRGVEFPTQDPEVREKVKKTVQERYGVDNVSQAEPVKKKIKETYKNKTGFDNPQKNPEVKNKSKDTCIDKYGVENPLQLSDKVKSGMKNKYGEEVPLRVPEIMEKKKKTSLERYGYEVASQSPEVRKKLSISHKSEEVKKKKYDSMKKNNSFHVSKEELVFYTYLLKVDPDAKSQQIHPGLNHVIDFYSPLYNLWIQYDGEYWHGDKKVNSNSRERNGRVRDSIKSDEMQDKVIKNLVRFKSTEVIPKIKDENIEEYIEATLSEKSGKSGSIKACHQYMKKLETYTEDLNTLPFDTRNLKASDFLYRKSKLTPEIREFIERYEWLGTIGNMPKWCFVAEYKEVLAGVVLINEPNKYSNVLGSNSPELEALIQRGASASWTPKNLGSKLIMFACKWMVHNTGKRAFVGYADPAAGERGVIYRACNFEYLGNNFGASVLYQHSMINKLFSRQYLERTASFKKWCRQNEIDLDPSWFKPNGYKDTKAIPTDIKESWRSWNSDIISRSNKIKIPSKMKFIKVLGRDKKELKKLNKLKTYSPKTFSETPSVKREDIDLVNSYKTNSGKTRSRKNSSKIDYILSNHKNLSRDELARDLNETSRWVKRQISNLIKEGKILPKR